MYVVERSTHPRQIYPCVVLLSPFLLEAVIQRCLGGWSVFIIDSCGHLCEYVMHICMCSLTHLGCPQSVRLWRSPPPPPLPVPSVETGTLRRKMEMFIPACCPVPTAGCLMPTACCPVPTACCPVPTASCLVPIACCLVPTVCCLMPTACCPVPTACCPVPTACCPVPTACCLVPTACCLVPTAYCPVPTACCPVPTTVFTLIFTRLNFHDICRFSDICKTILLWKFRSGSCAMEKHGRLWMYNVKIAKSRDLWKFHPVKIKVYTVLTILCIHTYIGMYVPAFTYLPMYLYLL